MSDYYDDNYTDRGNPKARRDRRTKSAGSLERSGANVPARRQSTELSRRPVRGERDELARHRLAAKRERSRRSAMLKEKRNVRKDIYVTSAMLVALFAAMIIYMVSYARTHSQELFTNDYNNREADLLAKNIRGRILADDGQILAQTTENEDGTETRSYPFKNLFSHVVGYTVHGGSGVELTNDYDLVNTGTTLSEKAAYDKRNEKYPGDDVVTTLNVSLQKAASDALGSNRGAVLVTEADTGKVLCDLSKPDFDPDTIEADWGTFDPDSGTLVNRATQGQYAPGSTFKIFDTIEFLQEDMSKATSYSFDCPGYVVIDNVSINCYHWEVHGHVDLKKSFAESCNSSFATIGTSLNRDSYNETLKNLMFREDLPGTLPTAQSTYVLDDSTSTKEVMQLAIGQGQTLMTPLHLNLVTAAIANGGTVYTPYVVDHIQTASGKVTSTTQPEAYRTIITPEIASRMQEYMRAVVTEGTASRLSTRPYNAAGKTGTAETSTKTSQSNAWFTGYAYDDSHKAVAITVIVENVGGSGGTSAVPVARDVLDAYFGYTPAAGEDDDANYIDWDHSNGGSQAEQTNSTQLNMDTNGDGIMDAVDIDGDGVPDAFDTDGDGIIDTNIGGSSISQAPAQATDSPAGADGSESAFNLDTDGDGVPDAYDADGDGIPDDPANTNGTGNTGGTDSSGGTIPQEPAGQTQTQENTAEPNHPQDNPAVQDPADTQAEEVLNNIEQQNEAVTPDEFNLDTDGDGTADAYDANGDGYPD